MTDSIEARLQALGLSVPAPPTAIGNFVPDVVHKDVLYVSGTYGTVNDGARARTSFQSPARLAAH